MAGKWIYFGVKDDDGDYYRIEEEVEDLQTRRRIGFIDSLEDVKQIVDTHNDYLGPKITHVPDVVPTARPAIVWSEAWPNDAQMLRGDEPGEQSDIILTPMGIKPDQKI